MAVDDDRLDDPELEDDAEDEFARAEDEEVSAELDEIVDDSGVGKGGEDEEDIDAVVELSSKEQNARSLEIRRAIEERLEERQFHEDIDYLDYDLDD